MEKRSIDYGDEKELVKRIDPSLTFIQNLHDEGTSCLSLHVAREDREYVLKVRKKSRNVFDELYFYYEIFALKRAAEYGIPGVTRLAEEIHHNDYYAILKNYIDGTPGNQFEEQDLFDNPEFVRRLDRLYLNLHIAGISSINFLPRKIVFTTDVDFTMVDLNTCRILTDIGINQFNLSCIEDSGYINRLERQLLKKGLLDRPLVEMQS